MEGQVEGPERKGITKGTLPHIESLCMPVAKYLATCEHVENFPALKTFITELNSIVATMAKYVDAHAKQLANDAHGKTLQNLVEQVEQSILLLIHSVKVYIISLEQGVDSCIRDAESNRNSVLLKQINTTYEIIRVLGLTTYDESEWAIDDVTVICKALNLNEGLQNLADKFLLCDPSLHPTSLGGLTVRQILGNAQKIADRCVEDGDAIRKAITECNKTMDELCEMRKMGGMGNNRSNLIYTKNMAIKIDELKKQYKRTLLNDEHTGIRKPAPTVAGIIKQAQKWLLNPDIADKGQGEQATREIIREGQRLAAKIQGPAAKQQIMRLCDELEKLTNQDSSPQAGDITSQLNNTLPQLKKAIQDAVVRQLAEDFVDVTAPLKPLKRLTKAALVLPDEGPPNREDDFEEKARNFDDHMRKLVDAARDVAIAGGTNDERIVEGIIHAAQEVQDLTPQVVKAARIVLKISCRTSENLEKTYDLLKQQLQDNLEKLQGFVDEATDTVAFIKACEEGIARDTERIEEFNKNADVRGVLTKTTSIAQRACRVSQVAENEANNSEDSKLVDRVNVSTTQLNEMNCHIIRSVKQFAFNPRDPTTAQGLREASQNVIDAMRGVRKAVTPNDC